MNRLRTVGGVAGITFISRITGYARDKVLALILGAGFQSDAFIVAFRIPNMFRALLAEGSLHAAFIPVFTRMDQESREEDLWSFATSFLYSLTFLLTGLTIIGILTAPWIVSLFAREFMQSPNKFELTVLLTRIMFPYIFLISLAGLFQGILNARKKFFIPAATPIFLNLSIILFGVMLMSRWTYPAYGFAVGVLVGGGCQMGIQWMVARKMGLSLLPRFPLVHPGVFRVFRLMIPGVFALGIYEINQLVATRFAASIGDAAVSYLYYSFRLTHLVYGGFVVALFTVFLPGLAEKTADRDEFRETLTSGLNSGLWVAIPASAGLWMLSAPIIRILFEGGKFSPGDTLQTALALKYYALALPAYALSKLFSSAYFAHHNTRLPAVSAFVSLVVFILSCVMLIPAMSHAGIALASTLGGYGQVVLLLCFLKREGISLHWVGLFREWAVYIISSAIMVLFILGLKRTDLLTGNLSVRGILSLLGVILVAAGLYCLSTFLFKSRAFSDILQAFRGERE